MSFSRLFLILAFTSSLLIVSSCSQKNEVDSVETSVISQLSVKNISNPEASTFASGQPNKKEFHLLQKAGIKHVINLRPTTEQDWDEEAFVKSLGMEYYSIPVSGKAGITDENAISLSELLTQLDGQSILVHCASGNRVGALIALNESLVNNASADEAINKGKLWGLTRLEPVVREKLSSQ